MQIREKIVRAMHDAYESAAKTHGWDTQGLCKVVFDDLPEANKQCMYAAADAALQVLAKPEPPDYLDVDYRDWYAMVGIIQSIQQGGE